MQSLDKVYLFLVVLGGRANKANVELHDVRWVVGSKIEDSFDILRRDWFGSLDGLHIDSYKKIKYIDGYKINLRKFEKNKINSNQLINKVKRNKNKNKNKNLWFVNIGGYEPNSMQEKHEFGLVIASNKSEAKNAAMSRWLLGCKKKHKDDIASLEKLISCDDCKLINNIGDWEVELTLDNNSIEENNYPDWYGYQKIDWK